MGRLWRPPQKEAEAPKEEDLGTAETEPPPGADAAPASDTPPSAGPTDAAPTGPSTPAEEILLSAPQPAPVMPVTASPSPQAMPERGRWIPPPDIARPAAPDTPADAERPPAPETVPEEVPSEPERAAPVEEAPSEPEAAAPPEEAPSEPEAAAPPEEAPETAPAEAAPEEAPSEPEEEAKEKRPPARRKRSFTRMILGDTFVDAPKLSRAASAAAAFDNETEAMSDSMFAQIVEPRTAIPWRLIIFAVVFIAAVAFGIVFLSGGDQSTDGSAEEAASETDVSTE
jgi:hypothetical protein